MNRLLALAQVFGQGKSFRDNPILGDPHLNRLGLHAARVALAHACVSARRAQLAPMVDASVRRDFERDGFVKIERFLPPATFEAALREARAERCALGRKSAVLRDREVRGPTHVSARLRQRREAVEAARGRQRDFRRDQSLRLAAARSKPPDDPS